MRATMSILGMLLALGVGGWLMVGAMGGSSGADGQFVAPDGTPATPTEAINKANEIAAMADLKRAEMEIQACAAQQDFSFAGCQLEQGGSVLLEGADALSFSLRSGDLVSSYHNRTHGFCHATVKDRTACSSW